MSLTTIILVKVMKVNFPLLLSVPHVAEKLFIIQQAIVIFVIGTDNVLKENISFIKQFKIT